MSRLMKAMGVEGFCMTVLTHKVSEGQSHAIQCAELAHSHHAPTQWHTVPPSGTPV